MNSCIIRIARRVSTRLSSVEYDMDIAEMRSPAQRYIYRSDATLIASKLNVIHDNLSDLADMIYSQKNTDESDEDIAKIYSPLYRKFYDVRENYYKFKICD